MDRSEMDFWIFSLDDPELYRFYDEQAQGDRPLYYAIYIKKVTRNFSDEVVQMLRLHDDAILLVNSYMMPLFLRLSLMGYAVVITEEFCEFGLADGEGKALLKLTFSKTWLEGIFDMGQINERQRKCIEMIHEEYCSPCDDLQRSVLRNMLANMAMLSSPIDYGMLLKMGHMLNCAKNFMDLVDSYAFREKNKSFYAGSMGITEKALTRALQFVFRRTFRGTLVGHTLSEAMKMLLLSDLSIARIARELNCDVSDFNRLFVRHRGKTPKQIRADYRRITDQI
jgi:AraC-like DNA-binding protein